MSLADKARNKATELMGRAKEKMGETTNNQNMQTKGTADRAEARSRPVGERAKDAGQDVRETFRG